MVILGRGFGPPMYVDPRPGPWFYPHRHDNPAELIGGVIGGVIGSYLRPAPPPVMVPPPPPPDQPPAPDEDAFHSAMVAIAKTPEGAVVYLNPPEFRSLSDRGMVAYDGTQPYSLKRQIQVSG